MTDSAVFEGVRDNIADSLALAKSEITALGLRYNLLTEYTSFVAVAKKVVNPGGVAQNVEQPLPLPAGVSNSAVGPSADGADEPELWLLLLGALVLLVRVRQPRRSELAQ